MKLNDLQDGPYEIRAVAYKDIKAKLGYKGFIFDDVDFTDMGDVVAELRRCDKQLYSEFPELKITK